jgi:hypothetical protein
MHAGGAVVTPTPPLLRVSAAAGVPSGSPRSVVKQPRNPLPAGKGQVNFLLHAILEANCYMLCTGCARR